MAAGQSSASGQLLVYSAGPEHLAEALATAFTQQTDIPVQLQTGSTGQISARLNRERDNPRADVVILAAWQIAERLASNERLLPYQAPESIDLGDQPAHPYIVPQAISALGIVWRQDSGLPRPNDWFDLDAPVYHDKIIMPNPVQSGSAFQLLAGLASTFGEQTWELFATMANHGLEIAPNNQAALDAVINGDKGIVFGAVNYPTLLAIEAGARLEFIMPASGTSLARRAMAIKASTARPDQARAFLDFILSDQGQKIVRNAHLIAADGGASHDGRPLADIPVLETDPRILGRRMGLLMRFAETIAE